MGINKLKFAPMNQEDYETGMNGVLKTSFTTSGKKIIRDTLYSSAGFGSIQKSDSYLYYGAVQDNTRKFVLLKRPVPNYMITRSDGSLFCKVMGISNKLFKKIVDFEIFYSKKKKDYCTLEEISSSEDLVCGGDLIKMLVEQVDNDLSNLIIDEFNHLLHEMIYTTKAPEFLGPINKDNGNDGIELLGGWYFHPVVTDCIKKNIGSPRDITRILQDTDFLAQTERRITFLLNTTKDRLRSFYLERVAILPIGLRPRTTEDSIDQFSMSYGKLIGCNNLLHERITNGADLKHIVTTYKQMSSFAKNLLIKSNERKMNEFSIKERLEGKTGSIRDEQIGKRSDYTGRSVILVDPHLRPDECGIPGQMLQKLYSAHLLKTKKRTLQEILDPNQTASIVKLMESQGLLDRIPTNLNRAPTLHLHSYQSYYPKVVEGKAIKLNPFVNEAYNADFDGDQMAVNTPQSDLAIEETVHLMLGINNIFKNGTGKCIVLPRLDMIYGLFMCTRGIYKVTDKPVKTYLEGYKDISEDMFSYKVKIWDTVEYDGEIMLAGNALVLACIEGVKDIPLNKFDLDNIDMYLSTWVGMSMDNYKNKINDMLSLVKEMYGSKVSEKEDELKLAYDTLIEYREFCSDRDRVRIKYYGKEKFGQNWKDELNNRLKPIMMLSNLIDNDRVSVPSNIILNSRKEAFELLQKDTIEKNQKRAKGEKLDPNRIYLNYKTIVNYKGEIGRLGNLLVREALQQRIIIQCSKRSIATVVDRLIDRGRTVFNEGLHRLGRVGFRVSKIYNPSIAVLNTIDREKLREPFEEFYKKIEPARELYKYGFETDSSYANIFNRCYREAENKVKDILMDLLPEDNGFRLLVESGARGDINNLLQIMSHKGRITKPNGDAFASVIVNSLLDQLTSLEHTIGAYGARSGLLDKSVKPGETGYFQRIIWHTTGDIIIQSEDCGTTKGVTYSLKDLIPFERNETDMDRKLASAKKTLRSMIVGRYEAKTNRYIDTEYADRLVDCREEVTIRSPITCEDICCAKCYGDDLVIQGKAVVGTPVGIQAGQSIGELLTQTTMKTFQKGGIAKEIVATSPFDRLRDLVKMVSISDKPDRLNYDPLAWGTGKIIREDSAFYIDKEEIKIAIPEEGVEEKHWKTYPKKILIQKGAYLKDEVKKGEGISLIQGDYDMEEYVKYNDFESAQKYHAISMFYQCKEEDLVFKHFEIVTAGMSMFLVTDTKNNNVKIGQLYTGTEIVKKNLKGAKVVRVMKGVLDVPLLREACVENINMENIQKGFSRAVLLGNEDDLDGILRSLMFGLKPRIGIEANPNFITERRKNMRCYY